MERCDITPAVEFTLLRGRRSLVCGCCVRQDNTLVVARGWDESKGPMSSFVS